EQWSARLSAAQLHRLWQLLLKGHEEVRIAPDPLVSAQMALLRIMHAADMPDPGALAKKLEELAEKGGGTSSVPPPPADGPAASLDWADLVRQVENSGQLRVAQLMHEWVRVVSLVPCK